MNGESGKAGTGINGAAIVTSGGTNISGTNDLSVNNSTSANGAPGQPGQSVAVAGASDTTAVLFSSSTTVSGAGNSEQISTSGTGSVITGPGNDTIQISGSNIMVDAGAGTNDIFISGGSSDSFLLHANGTDVISGFSLASKDVLDLRALLSEAKLSLDGDIARLGAYIQVTNINGMASVLFDPTGTGSGPASTIAVLQNIGGTITSLQDLISGGDVRIA